MEQNKVNPYNHSKIYKLIDPESQYYYWGSTCNRLSVRLTIHKNDGKKYPERKVCKAFNEIGWNKVKILLEKELCLENKDQLNKAENEYILASMHDEKCLNSYAAWTGLDRNEYKMQYNQEHAEQRKQRDKQYNEEHVEERKKYRQEHAEHIKQWHILYRQEHAEQIEKYRQEHAEEIKEQKKQYTKAHAKENTQRISQYRQRNSTKISCVCGSSIAKYRLSDHVKTKKHIDFINAQSAPI